MAKKQHIGPSGLIVVDKPAGVTSHDVVSMVRRLAGTRKVGHAGTLDPMATGVLILGVGKATKLLTWVVAESKTYTATIRLGISTVTDDAEGEVTAVADAEAVAVISQEQILAEVQNLTGEIMQVPTAVSAVKVDGVRSYARVRGGEDVQLQARPVSVSEFTVHSVRHTVADLTNQAESASVIDVEVTVSCSAGTYIRALARDMGAALGIGGHLTALRRTSIGDISVDSAHQMTELEQLREQGQPMPLLPMKDAVAALFAVREVSATEATDLSNGRRISPSQELTAGAHGTSATKVATGAHQQGYPAANMLTAAIAPNGAPVALLENQKFRGEPVAAPVLVFEAGQKFEDVS